MLNKLTGLAIAGLIATAAPIGAPIAAQETTLQYSLSRNVREPAQQAQAAIAQSNFPAASSYLNQAAAAAQTDGDRYVLATMQLDVANRTFNTAAQVAAINALLASPLLAATHRSELYYHRARISYHAQNGDAARTDLQAAIDAGTSNPRIYIAMASLLDEGRDHAGALVLVERAFEIHRTAGLATPVDWYRRAINIAQGLSDTGRISAYGQSMLAEHPTRRNWRDVLIQHRAVYAADPDAALDLWRLQEAAGALTGEFDYRDYARVANGRRFPGEIERIVQAGRANSVLDGGNSEIATLDRGTTAAAQNLRNALPGRAQAAAGSATGANALSAADDYMSLGDYAAAIPLYRTAIEKGSVDTELANIRLGMALARTGDAAGARAALDLAVGPRGSIARLWRVYADLPRAAPAPAAQVITPSE